MPRLDRGGALPLLRRGRRRQRAAAAGETRAVVRAWELTHPYIPRALPDRARAGSGAGAQPGARGRRGVVGGAHRRRRGRRPGMARRHRRGRHVGARRRMRHRSHPARRDRHARRRSCWSSSAATRGASGGAASTSASTARPTRCSRSPPGASAAGPTSRSTPRALRARGGFDTALGPRHAGHAAARTCSPCSTCSPAAVASSTSRARWCGTGTGATTRACASSCSTTASGWRPTSPPRPCGSPGWRSAWPGTWRRACGTSSAARRRRTGPRGATTRRTWSAASCSAWWRAPRPTWRGAGAAGRADPGRAATERSPEVVP